MRSKAMFRGVLISVVLIGGALMVAQTVMGPGSNDPGTIQCANLIYANNKSSVCFSEEFLKQVRQDTFIKANSRMTTVRSDSPMLFEYPFAVWTGEGAFELTDAQRANLRTYLLNGGFIVASAGCSSKDWNTSFRREIRKIIPDIPLETLDAGHPVFHTVYDITQSLYKSGSARLPDIEGLTIDGRTVLIYSPDGLNDTGNVGGNCCCCGGNEVKSAKQINVNLLVYALTH